MSPLTKGLSKKEYKTVFKTHVLLPLFVFIIFSVWLQNVVDLKTWQILMFMVFVFLSSPFKEEPSDMCEEEPHLRLCHGIHHQCHAHCSQSDAEEWHGVAAPTVSMEKASLHVHASG